MKNHKRKTPTGIFINRNGHPQPHLRAIVVDGKKLMPMKGRYKY